MSEKDETNFTSSSSHRLPTISAASAFQAFSKPENRYIGTGLPLLDKELAGSLDESRGGLIRGQVLEVYGPPGSGKTAFAMQATASTLHNGKSVVWIDTAQRLVGPRLETILSRFNDTSSDEVSSSPPLKDLSYDQVEKKFHHFFAPTLPHVLALIAQTSASFPPQDASLLVIDNVSHLFSAAFPQAVDSIESNRTKKPEAVQWANGRRWALMGDFTARLSKLATMNNIAVVMLGQASTKIRTEYGALLRPALSTKLWLENVNTRLVVFRDFLPFSNKQIGINNNRVNARFLGMVKHGGVLFSSLEKVIPFVINEDGLHQIEQDVGSTTAAQESVDLPVLPVKRKRDEIADSQSEDELGSDIEFAWNEEDQVIVVQNEILDVDQQNT